MIRAEFQAWIRTHGTAFATVRKTFEVLDEQGQESLRSIWHRVLEETDYACAEEATHRMLANPKLRPIRVDDHPAAVRDLAREILHDRQRAERQALDPHDPDAAQACSTCGGRGTVECWAFDPDSPPDFAVTLAPEDRSLHVFPYIATAACPDCPAGVSVYRRQAHARRPHASPPRDIPEPFSAFVRARLVPATSPQDRLQAILDAEDRWRDGTLPGWRDSFHKRATRRSPRSRPDDTATPASVLPPPRPDRGEGGTTGGEGPGAAEAAPEGPAVGSPDGPAGRSPASAPTDRLQAWVASQAPRSPAASPKPLPPRLPDDDIPF